MTGDRGADLPTAMAALAELGIHPQGVSVEGGAVALHLTETDRAAVLRDAARREQIVETLKAHGFLYVTLALHARDPSR